MLLHSKPGRAFIDGMTHIQKGIGVPSGCQRVAFNTRANYESGGASGKFDCANGFSLADRQMMAESWHRRFPEGGRVFNAAYGRDSAVLFMWVDKKTGLTHIVIKVCNDGSKQGCTLGSAGFCSLAQDAFEPTATAYPEFMYNAIIDDFFADIPKQPDDASWHASYDRYALMCAKYEMEWAKRGGKLKKCSLLLPPLAPMPKEGVLPAYVSVTKLGHVVLGAAIGTPDFIHQAAKEKVDHVALLLKQIGKLRQAGENAISFKLTLQGLVHSLTYFTSVNPPCLYMDQLYRHDDLIRCHTEADMSLPGFSVPTCTNMRRLRAHSLLQQPLSSSAASIGATPMSVVAGPAFLAGVLSASALPSYLPNAHHLQKFCIPIHALIVQQLGGSDNAFSKTKNLHPRLFDRLPVSPDALTDGPFATHLLIQYKKPRVQGIICKAIMKHRLTLLDEANSFEALAAGTSPGLTKNDAVAYHITRTKSEAAPVLSYRNSACKLVFPPKAFVGYLRFITMLPQLNRGPAAANAICPDTGSSLTKCMLCDKDILLDDFGNHVSSCYGSKDHAVWRHDSIRDVLFAFIRDRLPAAQAKHEPPAPFLLAGTYTQDECAALFHSQSTVATRLQALALRKLIDSRNNSNHQLLIARTRDASIAMAALVAVLINRRSQSKRATSDWRGRHKRLGTHMGGIRPDIMFSISKRQPPLEQWIDVAGLHDTVGLRIDQCLRQFQGKADKQGRVCGRIGSTPSPGVAQAATMKHSHFGPLVDAAAAQYARGTRMSKPTLVPFVITNRGEIGPEGRRLINTLCDEFMQSLPSTPPADGVPANRRAITTRRALWTDILVTNAIGVGRCLASSTDVPWGL
jgi:hypothetical protein